MSLLLEDRSFFKDYFEFRDVLDHLAELRIDTLGGLINTPIFQEDVPWSDKHDQYAGVMYSKHKLDWPRLKLPHESLRRFAHVFFAPLGIRASFGDYVFFEWLMGFNPKADDVQREHFGHVSKVAWCCLKLIDTFKEIQSSLDGRSIYDIMVHSIQKKFESFCKDNGEDFDEDTDFGRLLAETTLLAAYAHDKGIILNFYDDLREKVLDAFRPIWGQSLLYYGGDVEGARRKYSSFCRGDCENIYEPHEECTKLDGVYPEDPRGMERVRAFFEEERVLGREFWLDVFCNDAAPRFPRTVYHESKKNYHGVYAALELLAMQIGYLRKRADKIQDHLEREFVLALAAQAVAFHDLKVDKRIDIEEAPQAFLLYLADEIQQWQRHQLDINKLLDARELDWIDGEIQQVCLEAEENDLFIEITKLSREADVRNITENIGKASRKIEKRLNTRGHFTIHYFIDRCNECGAPIERELVTV